MPTAVPASVTLSTRNSVPTSVWQHDRRVVDYASVRPPPAPAAAFPLLPTPHRDEDEAIRVRAVTNTLGSVTTVTVPFPTVTAPPAHAHVHRAPSSCDGDSEDDGHEDEEEKREMHARMLALPIKGVGVRPHATTTLNSIKVRQLFLPTAIVFNAAAAAKVTVA